MKTPLALNSLLCGLLLAAPAFGLEVSDPKKYLKENFWGNIYKEGGTTFYCNKPFKKKGILIDEAYIYSDSWIRDELDCGSPRQCRQNDARYRAMISDMHNIYPAQSRYELQRKNARFAGLGDRVTVDDCGSKRSFDVMEPNNEIKGDIARAILYMYHTYKLPIVGSLEELKRWAKQDPATPEEEARNKHITEIQGNSNVFISIPARVDELH